MSASPCFLEPRLGHTSLFVIGAHPWLLSYATLSAQPNGADRRGRCYEARAREQVQYNRYRNERCYL